MVKFKIELQYWLLLIIQLKKIISAKEYRSQLGFTCLKLTTESLEQVLKHVQDIGTTPI